MANKQGMKRSRNLERSARLAPHYKSIRSHRIAHARQMHLKHAIKSCGLKFAEKLREYYSRVPAHEVQPRRGYHRVGDH